MENLKLLTEEKEIFESLYSDFKLKERPDKTTHESHILDSNWIDSEEYMTHYEMLEEYNDLYRKAYSCFCETEISEKRVDDFLEINQNHLEDFDFNNINTLGDENRKKIHQKYDELLTLNQVNHCFFYERSRLLRRFISGYSKELKNYIPKY